MSTPEGRLAALATLSETQAAFMNAGSSGQEYWLRPDYIALRDAWFAASEEFQRAWPLDWVKSA